MVNPKTLFFALGIPAEPVVAVAVRQIDRSRRGVADFVTVPLLERIPDREVEIVVGSIERRVSPGKQDLLAVGMVR